MAHTKTHSGICLGLHRDVSSYLPELKQGYVALLKELEELEAHSHRDMVFRLQSYSESRLWLQSSLLNEGLGKVVVLEHNQSWISTKCCKCLNTTIKRFNTAIVPMSG